MANDKIAAKGTGARTARKPAAVAAAASELEILGTVREFCKTQGLKLQRGVVPSLTGSENPTIRVQAGEKGNKDMELEANGVGGIVMSQAASAIYPIGSKIDIDSLSVGYGESLETEGVMRYVICTGGVFEDVDDIE